MSDLDSDLYNMVRRMAARSIAKHGHATIDPTELMHEAWMKVVASGISTNNRTHFIAVTAKAMRHVLVDHARKRVAEKRGGGVAHTTLSGVTVQDDPVGVLAMEALLDELQKIRPRLVEIIELRVYGGLTVPECAEALGVSPRTVNADWRFARAWLQSHLEAPG